MFLFPRGGYAYDEKRACSTVTTQGMLVVIEVWWISRMLITPVEIEVQDNFSKTNRWTIFSVPSHQRELRIEQI